MNRIYSIREENDLTQEEFAKIFNVNRTLVSKWENEDCFPSIEKLNLISNHYKISFDYIFGFTKQRRCNKEYKELIDNRLAGCRLKSFREKNKLTLRKIADELHTTSSTISAYETGKTILLVAFAIQICKKYKISMDWLYGKTD